MGGDARHVLIESAAFEGLGDRTRVTTTLLFHTTEERDGMLSSGMETGMSESQTASPSCLPEPGSGPARILSPA